VLPATPLWTRLVPWLYPAWFRNAIAETEGDDWAMCIRAKLKPPASSPSLLWIHSSIIDCGLPRRNAHSLSCFVFPSVPTVLVYTYAWREGSSETAATYVKTHFFHLSYRRQGGPEPSIFSTALLVWGGRSSIGVKTPTTPSNAFDDI
jgi:hypothetical protein